MACRSVPTLVLFYIAIIVSVCEGRDEYHGRPPFGARHGQITSIRNEPEQTAAYWYEEARAGIEQRVARGAGGGGVARNVVLFLGDGMSVPTLAAARTLLGQRQGRAGEEARLAFETFPTVGLSKTYCVDAQTADSACSASAYLCGAKANIGTIGVDARVPRRDCLAATERGSQLSSLAEWALAEGRGAGLVTSTRVTHASPAGLYAHTADRDWESDADVRASCGSAPAQPDIALQLVHSFPGNRLKVILGGGRREFLPVDVVDEEGDMGRRLDGRNLIREWQEDKEVRNASYLYARDRDTLRSAAEHRPDYLLGLFESSHMQYHLDADPRTEPTLAELTEIAIETLRRDDEGFILFVEGGRIDHAHHENKARLALDETIELAAAVQRATELLSAEDSLLVVTADHAHVMAFNGYTRRGGDILGPSDDRGDDGVPYMTLSYTNGPGFRPHVDGARPDVTQDPDYGSAHFAFPASVPLESETHGADDVAVFAWGAQHDMFSGLYEQSQLPHLMGYAACLGPGPRGPACPKDPQ